MTLASRDNNSHEPSGANHPITAITLVHDGNSAVAVASETGGGADTNRLVIAGGVINNPSLLSNSEGMSFQHNITAANPPTTTNNNNNNNAPIAPAPLTTHVPYLNPADDPFNPSINTLPAFRDSAARTIATAGSSKQSVSGGGQSCSPQSLGDGDETEGVDEKKKQPVKRACNECRQQKLRCDVIQDPFVTCTRCRRLKLECKIEPNFRRVGKRSRNAEMEREIIELRKQVANANANAAATATTTSSPTPHLLSQQQKQHLTPSTTHLSPSVSLSYGSSPFAQIGLPSRLNQEDYMRPDEAVASLLDLKSGVDSSGYARSPSGQFLPPKRIDDVFIPGERVAELFNQFFTYYHPFLPFLDTDKSADDYYSLSPLLFWSIISIGSRRYQPDPSLLNALSGPVLKSVWSTLAEVPRNYHIVKALALLCTWPFPTSSTSTDPTFMLCGMMMQVALQIGLHRPSHAQDFSKFRVEFREGELKDRVKTWAICNTVAQRIATGYGQPSSTVFDYTLSSKDPEFDLPREIKWRLEIEKFCDKVSRTLYGSRRDPVGVLNDTERYIMVTVLSRDFEELESQIRADPNSITSVYLRAAGLHLHLSIFFDNPTTKDYRQGLSALYIATTSFLEATLGLETAVQPAPLYCSNYIYQMTLAAGFSLFKLCNSFFAAHLDMEYAKTLFTKTIRALRSMSVSINDLPQRLAEVLAQMWRMDGVGSRRSHDNSMIPGFSSDFNDKDDSLTLKVRCRMGMSLVFDSVWRWREDAQAKGRNLESYLKNPTNPDSGAESSSSSSIGPLRATLSTPGLDNSDPTLSQAIGTDATSTSAVSTHTIGASLNTGLPSGFLEPNYEVFDPLNWMLDGLLDFPYSYPPVQGLEVSGIV
ncbi:hypothetical protein FQN57_004224 [Myotisia sp. PD_48]|nr:hypothetical protein FQN57_004224 [Myotisia sp. PD_48]